MIKIEDYGGLRSNQRPDFGKKSGPKETKIEKKLNNVILRRIADAIDSRNVCKSILPGIPDSLWSQSLLLPCSPPRGPPRRPPLPLSLALAPAQFRRTCAVIGVLLDRNALAPPALFLDRHPR